MNRSQQLRVGLALAVLSFAKLGCEAAVAPGGADGEANDASSDAASDATGATDAADAGIDCGYAVVQNDPACPPSSPGVAAAYRGTPCSDIGLTCSYPGQGDGMGNGCYYTGGLWCAGDAGDDGGVWMGAQ